MQNKPTIPFFLCLPSSKIVKGICFVQNVKAYVLTLGASFICRFLSFLNGRGAGLRRFILKPTQATNVEYSSSCTQIDFLHSRCKNRVLFSDSFIGIQELYVGRTLRFNSREHEKQRKLYSFYMLI